VVIVGAVHGGEETISNAQLVPSCSLDFSGDQVAMATTLPGAEPTGWKGGAGPTLRIWPIPYIFIHQAKNIYILLQILIVPIIFKRI
jgi:hypothetical protein